MKLGCLQIKQNYEKKIVKYITSNKTKKFNTVSL